MKHETLYALAHAAGLAAAERMTPTPMVVQERANMLDDASPVTRSWYVADGVRGFAWIIVRPGTCSFARWLVKQNKGERTYHGGIQVWVSEFGQSMDRKMAYASAFAKALRINGVKAYSGSRMD